MAIPVIPIAIGAAGVAAILGYLIFSGGKPKLGTAASAAAVKPPPAKKSASGGSGGVSKGASPVKVDWKLAGYRAGFAMGKLDAAGKGGIGVAEFIAPSRVAPGTKPMPGTPGGLSASTPEGGLAVAAWTTGYADGYPKGFGKPGTTTPKYAADDSASDGTEAYSLDSGGEATSEGTSGTTDSTGDSMGSAGTSDTSSSDGGASEAASSATDAVSSVFDTLTSGVRTGQTLVDLYHPMHRPVGEWGPRQHVLAHAKRGVFTRTGWSWGWGGSSYGSAPHLPAWDLGTRDLDLGLGSSGDIGTNARQSPWW